MSAATYLIESVIDQHNLKVVFVRFLDQQIARMRITVDETVDEYHLTEDGAKSFADLKKTEPLQQQVS